MKTMQNSRILILYSELSGYVQACINELAKRVHEVHIVRWSVNSEAPFVFTFESNVLLYERNEYTVKSLVDFSNSIQPNLILTSGWMDKGYLEVCKVFKDRIPTIMSMDNHWYGTVKQHIATLLAPFTLHKRFSHIWIPGKPQELYAKKLGFKAHQILYGFYSADVFSFIERFNSLNSDTNYIFPKRFIYVGRYVEQKGLDTLFDAFIEFQKELPNDWDLWCIGTGAMWNKRPIHNKINHIGFVQPNELIKYINNTSIFVLPSKSEPWGVVVHEMASAGFPLICSKSVGAASQFLEDGINGWSFNAGDINELKNIFKLAIVKSNDELRNMSYHSNKLAMSWTPIKWADLIISILEIKG